MISLSSYDNAGTYQPGSTETFKDVAALKDDLESSASDEYRAEVLEGLTASTDGTFTIRNTSRYVDRYVVSGDDVRALCPRTNWRRDAS